MLQFIGSVTLSVTQRLGEVSPVPQPALPTFRAPYTGGFFGAASPSSLHAFCCLHHHPAGFGFLLAHLREYTLTMRQASLDVTDCWVAMTSLLCLDHSLTGRLLRGCLVVTSAGLAPASGLTFVWARRGEYVESESNEQFVRFQSRHLLHSK